GSRGLDVEWRKSAAPQVRTRAQYVAIAAYGDEAHVKENRMLYSEKFDLADRIVGDRYGYKRPAGGFFLWLDVAKQGGSEVVTKKLWKEAGGRGGGGGWFRAREGRGGKNRGGGIT